MAQLHEAQRFLNRGELPIEPRKRWPGGPNIPNGKDGKRSELAQEGRALAVYRDSGWGESVARGKYKEGYFEDALVKAAMEVLQQRWNPDPPPVWVTCVPSREHPELVPSFTRRLAERLGLPFFEAIVQTREKTEQKVQQNSYHQFRNIRDAFEVGIPQKFQNRPVLLVDDIVDSRWTFTHLAALLRREGAGEVYPLALAIASKR